MEGAAGRQNNQSLLLLRNSFKRMRRREIGFVFMSCLLSRSAKFNWRLARLFFFFDGLGGPSTKKNEKKGEPAPPAVFHSIQKCFDWMKTKEGSNWWNQLNYASGRQPPINSAKRKGALHSIKLFLFFIQLHSKLKKFSFDLLNWKKSEDCLISFRHLPFHLFLSIPPPFPLRRKCRKRKKR